MYYCYYPSPVGTLTLTGTQENLTGVWMDTQKNIDGSQLHFFIPERAAPSLKAAKKWLDLYFSGSPPPISTLPLELHGSSFQLFIWEQLCQIPFGQTITYGQLANIIASSMGVSKMSAQAVGGAVGRNPISIIIPCHRVIGANKHLTGYAGGIDKKIWLLKLEGIDLSDFQI